eukprot:3498133-Pleurochrysis_carterae.AAC.3
MRSPTSRSATLGPCTRRQRSAHAGARGDGGTTAHSERARGLNSAPHAPIRTPPYEKCVRDCGNRQQNKTAPSPSKKSCGRSHQA